MERFWKKVKKTDTCWNWTASTMGTGYGQFHYNKRTRTSHTVSWELTNGLIPEGLVVRHTCDNRLCCNPEHLLLGTQADNLRDAADRDRIPHGEQRSDSKLTEAQVKEIKLAKVINISQTARSLGVSRAAVQKIRKGQTWIRV